MKGNAVKISEFAVDYVSRKGLARTPIYSANRFAKLVGDIDISEVTQEHMETFRKAAESAGLSAWTIRGGLKDLKTLLSDTGKTLTLPLVRRPDPNPQPVPLEHIDKLWPFLGPWSKQWLAVSYWTGLRLADVIKLQGKLTECPAMAEDGRLEWEASKTRRRQRWPVPVWLRQFLKPESLPYGKCQHHNSVIVRAELERCCKLATIDRILPSQIRDTALTEWCRADLHVGQILHGCKLGVIGHYVDPIDVIAPVGPRVRLPKCFGGQEAQEDIGYVIERLDPEARRIVREMAVRMVRG